MTQSEQIRILRNNIRIYSDRSALSQQQKQLCVSQAIDRWLRTASPQEPDILYRLFLRQFPEMTEADRARFCLSLVETLPNQNTLLFDKFFLGAEEEATVGSHGGIALVRNRYNERAFTILSPTVIGAKQYPAPSFSDACEDIANNRCKFSILPLENTHDGRLFGFYAMLDRYELKICAVCSLETENLVGNTRYALVGRSLPDRIPKHCTWSFECSIATAAGSFPHDILTVAAIFHAELLSIDSLPVLYDEELQRFYFAFRIPKEHAMAFHLYCSMEHSRYTPIGLYPIL
ncbi:MAG: hypothetical protein IJY47_01040 [Clostridia bacterium]|nr:hypothetical protein [Clostridia bacterium]